MTTSARIDAAIAAARREPNGFVRVTDVCTFDDARRVLCRHTDIRALVVQKPRGTKQRYGVLPIDALRRLLTYVPIERIIVRNDGQGRTASLLDHALPINDDRLNAGTVTPTQEAILASAEEATLTAVLVSATPTISPTDLTIRQELAAIKGVPLEEIGTIRITPQGMPSLVDVGVAITGKAPHHVARDIQVIFAKNLSIIQKVDYTFFDLYIDTDARGRRSTPVPQDLATLIEVIFLLPGSVAAQVRRSAAQLFVRILGGDLSLIPEIEQLNHIQASLRESNTEHPLRRFGEAIEAAAPIATLHLRPDPQVIRASDSVGLPGAHHLYAFKRLSDGIIKLGETNQPLLRRIQQVQTSFEDRYALIAIWPREAVLEDITRDLLFTLKASIGSSREHFNITFEQLCEQVVLARKLYRAQCDANEGDEPALKRRKLELQLDREAADIERVRVESERTRADIEGSRSDREILALLIREGDVQARSIFLARLAPPAAS